MNLGRGARTVRGVQLADVRASFACHYQPKGCGRKNAERQAFTRALKAVLEEGTVEQRTVGSEGLALAEG
jgi:hypothetical protein